MKVLTNKDVKKHFKRQVNNKIRVYGDTDIDKKVIRINKKKNSNSPRKGELLDTIVHEAHHAKHPHKHEKTVRKDTKRIVKHLNSAQKQRYYKLFS